MLRCLFVCLLVCLFVCLFVRSFVCLRCLFVLYVRTIEATLSKGQLEGNIRDENIVRNGSLWSDVVFAKEVFFHEFDFETSDLEFEVSKSSI